MSENGRRSDRNSRSEKTPSRRQQSAKYTRTYSAPKSKPAPAEEVRTPVKKKRRSPWKFAIGTLVLTAVCTVLLLFGGMDLYESLTTSFSAAGTGGFAIWPDSMATFNNTVAHPEFCIWVLSIFMLLFAINFNLKV